MSGLEQRIADVCRGFIVRSVGQDMGVLMTEQAKSLAAEIVPLFADELERMHISAFPSENVDWYYALEDLEMTVSNRISEFRRS